MGQTIISLPVTGFNHSGDGQSEYPYTCGALYETLPPDRAKTLWDRFEFVYTPKHGSWLNVAEIELNVMIHQCLARRIDDIEELKKEVMAWQHHRDQLSAKVNWHFTTKDARIKLKRLYPPLVV